MIVMQINGQYEYISIAGPLTAPRAPALYLSAGPQRHKRPRPPLRIPPPPRLSPQSLRPRRRRRPATLQPPTAHRPPPTCSTRPPNTQQSLLAFKLCLEFVVIFVIFVSKVSAELYHGGLLLLLLLLHIAVLDGACWYYYYYAYRRCWIVLLYMLICSNVKSIL